MLNDKSLFDHTQLVSHISHDLRNILTLIDSSLQLMERNHPEVVDYKFWPETKNDIKYMKTYLLALSYFNKSGLLSLSKFDLKKMLRELRKEYLLTFPEKNLSIILDLNKDVEDIVGDPIKLDYVFRNIILNSIEACEVKDTYGEIKIILEKVDSGILIKISDNGQGIPIECINDIFTPFSTSKKEHVGLGLSSCFQIINGHNGTIEVESTPTIGSTVTIKLPSISL